MDNRFLKCALGASFLLLSIVAVKAQNIPDKDIKRNIADIESPLEKIALLHPKQFEYRAKDYKYLKLGEGAQYGFMTENVKAVFPHLVKEKKVSYMFGKNAYRDAKVSVVNETGLIPVLVASIKQQQEEIERLKAALLKLKEETASR